MEGSIVTKKEFKIAGMGWTGPFSAAPEIPGLWRAFAERVHEIEYRIHPFQYVAASHDRPTDFTYYIGMEVSDWGRLPDGMIGLTIPTQRYARFTFTGPMAQVSDFYVRCFDWIRQEGYEKNKAVLGLESYDQRYHPAVDDPDRVTNEFEIYIPLQS
ncbi:AraC family transcriptional regulator [Paenibacillus dendritiformis]|uniref:GyrI-like domain-containing protein n=1 Tax=Paenibacillus dendritiformis TaxID=130049 RepID=UPI00143DEBB7|nr:GyrI-like domain-containing protein [Paenibacillus dendritiformis]NKI23640.1 AraC family transcriptional regulator [Paenibacillus dendritiformis]NRF99385.1 AraC family transcriptional regulator [Paenibacillus dendritiformis]